MKKTAKILMSPFLQWRRDVAFAGFEVPIQMAVSAEKLIFGVGGVDPKRRDELINVRWSYNCMLHFCKLRFLGSHIVFFKTVVLKSSIIQKQIPDCAVFFL